MVHSYNIRFIILLGENMVNYIFKVVLKGIQKMV
jgi:hypothetical protein